MTREPQQKDINPRPTSIIRKVILLFSLLIGLIIANGLHITGQYDKHVATHTREDLQSRLDIASSLISIEIDKLNIIAGIIREQNQKYVNFLDYENINSIKVMLSTLSIRQQVERVIIFDEDLNVLTTNEGQPAPHQVGLYSILIENLEPGLTLIPSSIVIGGVETATQQPEKELICFKKVVPLYHDLGGVYGYIVLLKPVSGNMPMARNISSISKAEFVIFDGQQKTALTSFDEEHVSFPHDNNIKVQDVEFLTSQRQLLDATDNHIGTLVIAIDRQPLTDQRRQLLMSSFLPFLAILLFSVFLFYLLKSRIINRVNQLISILKRVVSGEGELDLRMEEKKSEGIARLDEMDLMAINFNRMMAKLEETYQNLLLARQETELINRELEYRVEQRTSELAASNIKLREEITQREQLQERLQQAQKMEAIGTMAGGIAHDFNNILVPILGYSEMALRSAEPGSKLSKDVHQIIHAANRARELIQQILTLSRQKKEQLKPLRIQILIKEALKMMRSTLPTNIDIIQDIDSECPTILADPTQIHQIIMNLCMNAFHAMEFSGGILGVSLHEVELLKDEPHGLSSGKYICLKIQDNGGGIQQKDLKRIFEPYFTTKEEGKGTGLGLAVVHGIVLSYGGHIKVDSKPDEGTIFEILLPIQEEGLSTLDDEDVAENLPGGSEHIMLVDDQSIVLEATGAILTELGYTVHALTDPTEALQIVQKDLDAFQLIITDQTMPGMQGVELAEKILKLRPEMPVILCTGFTSTITKEEALKVGIKAYLFKPVKMKELAHTVRQILDQDESKK